MPPERTTKTKPFKAPRPSNSTARSSRAASTESAESDDPFSSPPAQTRTKASAATKAAPNKRTSLPVSVPDEYEEEPKANIPPELLTKILHEFFQQDGTRMSKDAGLAVGKYMETFVREAIARAAHERSQSANGAGDDFLEVEDLEKLAPQLLLDF